MTVLGNRLKELRADLSLMDIAREIGLSDTQILNIEKGTRKPKKTTLKKLAELYQVRYTELRKLYYTDLFSEDFEERQIILEWANEAQDSLK